MLRTTCYTTSNPYNKGEDAPSFLSRAKDTIIHLGDLQINNCINCFGHLEIQVQFD